jgi:hypothetical protein
VYIEDERAWRTAYAAYALMLRLLARAYTLPRSRATRRFWIGGHDE